MKTTALARRWHRNRTWLTLLALLAVAGLEITLVFRAVDVWQASLPGSLRAPPGLVQPGVPVPAMFGGPLV